MSHWSAAYIGLSAAAVGDEICWDLVRRVLAERAGVDLPAYPRSAAGDPTENAMIAAIIRCESVDWPLDIIPLGAERDLDIAVFRRGAVECHAGIVVATGRMLHLSSEYDARIERFDLGRWRHRLACIYRHRNVSALPDAA